jgi:hypothetical protein
VGRFLWRENVLSFTIAAGPRQRSHSRVWVPWDSRPYFTVSDSRPSFSSPPTTRRATVEVLDPASTQNSTSSAGVPVTVEPVWKDRVENTVSKSFSIVAWVSVTAETYLLIRSPAASVYSCLLNICCLVANVLSMFRGCYPATAVHDTILLFWLPVVSCHHRITRRLDLPV